MKALSLTQPMAWAIFHGKDVENRTWPTKFRGRVYIHASKGFDMGHYRWMENISFMLSYSWRIPLPEYFVHGALIGEVDIIDCVESSESLWWTGPFGFMLANPVQYDKSIPCKGMLKFFTPKFEPEKHKGR